MDVLTWYSEDESVINVTDGCVLRWSSEDESVVNVQLSQQHEICTYYTTPRNELCGALLEARMAQLVLNAFEDAASD